MKEEQADISPEELWFILNNPWSISKAEWRLGDQNNRESMFEYIQEMLELAKKDGYSRLWRTSEDEPISLLGCYKMSEKNYTTFLVSSYHYEEYAMKLSFDIRKVLRQKAKDYKGYTLGIYSTSQHPYLFTWLRFLGFKHRPEKNQYDRRYFEYIAKG